MKPIPIFDGTTAWKHTLHTHSVFSDGKCQPIEYVDAAIQIGLKTLGFSSHAPVPDPPGTEAVNLFWCMPLNRLQEYKETITELKDRFADDLDIRMGLEIDYIPDIMGPDHPIFQDLDLDYTIGSVHAAGTWPDGKVWTVDCSPEKFVEGINALYGGSVEKAGREYFRRIREMVAEQRPDIIGHFDLIKKNNRTLKFLDESAGWYRDAVYETLETIAAAKCIVEINTGGMARGFIDQPYPSLFIMKQCRKLHIPVMINSDAHHPDNLTAKFDQAAEFLIAAGY